MASGRSNKLVGQVAENLVCAELGRRNLIATPFAGNVPVFDVIAADANCRTVPIQVKATTSDGWPGDARTWMDIEFDTVANKQNYKGLLTISNPDLIYVCVVVRPVLTGPDDSRRDRFFILTKRDIQRVSVESYTTWMESHGWRRPRNPASFDCRYRIKQILQFENNWSLIETQLSNGAAIPESDAVEQIVGRERRERVS
jgi:hypothetical protein